MRWARHVPGAIAAALCLIVFAGPADATKIERVVSPGGIEAWLVREPTVPLIALDFAFLGGGNEDPTDKPGVANMVSDLLDEGAGELDANAFHERIEQRAIELSFQAGRDYFRGSLRTLNANRDEAIDLLRLALTSPRFAPEAVERIRSQVLSGLRRETTSPSDIANHRWWAAAFPDHPYGRPLNGSLDSVPKISANDLHAYVKRVFARDTLKVAAVGDIDSASLGLLLDRLFGALPAKAELRSLAPAKLHGAGERIDVPLDVPQSVISFGGLGVARSDPDFMAAFIVNHILGGGSFSSRLYSEVREKRGLAYSVRTSLIWYKYAALIVGGTATRADRTDEAVSIIEREVQRLAESGPTEEELAKTKSFLKGSYALNFDTSSKISGQLVQIQIDDLGIDYIGRRDALIDAVTEADVKRIARQLLDQKLLMVVVGRRASGKGG
jgi:zinc protease